MTNFEHQPTPSPLSSDELIQDLLEGHDTEHSNYYRNMMYAAAIEELRKKQRPFDEIREVLFKYRVLKPEDTENAEGIKTAKEYQPLLDELYDGRLVEFQRSDGNFYTGIIDGEPMLRIDIDIARSQIVCIIEVSIEYEGEVDYLPFYPRRSHESDEMFIPGLKLH